MDRLLDLLKRFAALQRAPKTRKGKYPASKSPYKPLLLLAVLRRVQQEKPPYANNRILYGECLRDFTFLYSRLYGNGGKTDVMVTHAFWYLGTGKPEIWRLLPKANMGAELAALASAGAQIKSAPKLNRLVESAAFAEEDWRLITDADVQRALISFLIAGHFVDVRRQIESL